MHPGARRRSRALDSPDPRVDGLAERNYDRLALSSSRSSPAGIGPPAGARVGHPGCGEWAAGANSSRCRRMNFSVGGGTSCDGLPPSTGALGEPPRTFSSPVRAVASRRGRFPPVRAVASRRGRFPPVGAFASRRGRFPLRADGPGRTTGPDWARDAASGLDLDGGTSDNVFLAPSEAREGGGDAGAELKPSLRPCGTRLRLPGWAGTSSPPRSATNA